MGHSSLLDVLSRAVIAESVCAWMKRMLQRQLFVAVVIIFNFMCFFSPIAGDHIPAARKEQCFIMDFTLRRYDAVMLL